MAGQSTPLVLGASSVESLARLIRHLNSNVRWKPTTARAAIERADFIAAAQKRIQSLAQNGQETDTEPAIATRVTFDASTRRVTQGSHR